MSTVVYKPGVDHAAKLIADGKVTTATFDFNADDANKLLGPKGDNWEAYGSYHLALHPSETKNTKAYYGYPFGKDDKVYRNAVVSAKGRAAQHNATDVEAACSMLLDAMDKKGKQMEMKRAYATINFKTFNENKDGRLNFEGIASTPTPDRVGDIVEPKGARFKLPMPFLYQHNSRAPIGQITGATVKDDGIYVKGYVENLHEPPSLKERLDVARAELQAGLVRGLSIGFRDTKSEPINPKDPWGPMKFEEWDWLELSAVTIPANADASITAIKSVDQAALASLGNSADSTISLRPLPNVKSKGIKVKTIQEQVTAFEAKRQASKAAADAMMEKAAEEESTLTEEQSAEYETLMKDVIEIDKHLVRLRSHEKTLAETAKPVVEDKTEIKSNGSRVKNGDFRMKLPELPAGIGMARYVKAFAFAKGNYQQAAEYAKQWTESTPEVEIALKAAISAGTTTSTTWAGPLVYAQDFPAAFLEFLRPQTIIGKLTGLSHVPFNIRYGIQDGGTTVAWVGQGAPKPVSQPTFTSGSLGFAKAAGIVVITQELARFSSPSAELKIRDDLTAQMVYFLDQQFIDPSVAAVANVSPASVTNGATNVRQAAGTWTTMANVLTDVKAFLSVFAANEISLQGAYWVMTPDTALSVSLLLNTGGTAFAFPEVDVNGGTWLGLPVIVSNAVPHSVSAGSIVVLIIPKWVYIADEGGIAVDSSTEASLQMDSAPTNNSATPTATTLVSMFQTNSIAIRVERVINWARARAYGVGYIDNMHTS